MYNIQYHIKTNQIEEVRHHHYDNRNRSMKYLLQDQDYRLSYFEEKISKSKERNSKFRKQGSKGIAR